MQILSWKGQRFESMQHFSAKQIKQRISKYTKHTKHVSSAFRFFCYVIFWRIFSPNFLF